MKKLLCYVGFHNWKYSDKINRTCENCSKSQYYVNEGTVSGFSDFAYWKNNDIKTK